jgi:small subunit ribosomal protein S6
MTKLKERQSFMPLYEHILLGRQDISAQQFEGLVETYQAIIKDNGGSIEKTENWGIKNLAYKIKKNRKAHFALMNIDAPHEAVAEMERQMGISTDVIRFLTLRMDELDAGPSAMMKRGDRDDRRGGRGDRDRGPRGDRDRDRGPRVERPKADKQDTGKVAQAGEKDADTSKADTSPPDTSKAETDKADTSKAETDKADTSKADTSAPDTSKADTDTSKAETDKAETDKADTSPPDTSKAETDKADTSKEEE